MADVVSLDLKKPKRRKKDDFGDKVLVHQRYYVTEPDGSKTMVPGSTTILGMVPKPYLVKWANRLGLDGIDTDKYRDEAADSGTCLHYLVECDVLGKTPDLKDFTPAQVERAQLGLAAFRAWRKAEAPDLKPIGVELRLTSQLYRYGGTLDLYAMIGGKRTLVDYKTASSVYLEHKSQVTSYVKLARENDLPIERAVIVQLPRVEDADYVQHRLMPKHMALYWRLFRWAHEGYDLQKEIKRAGA